MLQASDSRGRIALLDANVLIALFDQEHIHHEAAHEWFEENQQRGWATCPITENAFLRIMSGPGYTHSDYWRPVADLRRLLAQLCSSDSHHFWPDDISPVSERFDLTAVTSRQTTDVYLLGLAVSRRGYLATFDRRIRASAVRGAESDDLFLIAPET